jgi:lariat debranching enzyme
VRRLSGIPFSLFSKAIRSASDLDHMVCPEKFKKIGDFADYHCGRKLAPVSTIFIGGNHEASNVLWENYFGGWLCHNIFFLGFSGVINVCGMRIAGISGIYKHANYWQGYFERLPFTNEHDRSIYHYRQFEVLKLSLVIGIISLFLDFIPLGHRPVP